MKKPAPRARGADGNHPSLALAPFAVWSGLRSDGSSGRIWNGSLIIITAYFVLAPTTPTYPTLSPDAAASAEAKEFNFGVLLVF